LPGLICRAGNGALVFMPVLMLVLRVDLSLFMAADAAAIAAPALFARFPVRIRRLWFSRLF
jgi:hypothetical protein